MHSNVVPDCHHLEMKRKALEAELVAARKEELDAADPKQQKRIMKEIEKVVHDKLKLEQFMNDTSFIIR